MTFLEILKEDLKALTLQSIEVTNFHLIKSIIYNYKLRIVIRLRISQHLIKRGGFCKKIAHIVYWQNLRRGVDISPLAVIGSGLRLAHPIGIVIGDRCTIGKFCSILQNVTIGGSNDKQRIINNITYVMPIVEDFVEVGAGSIIAGPVVLGKYCRIGGNSLVLKDVEMNAIVGGVPAIVIKINVMRHSHGLVGLFSKDNE